MLLETSGPTPRELSGTIAKSCREKQVVSCDSAGPAHSCVQKPLYARHSSWSFAAKFHEYAPFRFKRPIQNSRLQQRHPRIILNGTRVVHSTPSIRGQAHSFSISSSSPYHIDSWLFKFSDGKTKSHKPAQEWNNRILIGHEPLLCSKMSFTKTKLVQ